jgi:hypothetical protein
MNLPSTDVSHARLPVAYEEAKRALAQCSKVDECQDWADKAMAMASYARQSNDETLYKYAERIKARAIRRCGELLRQVPAANGSRTDVEPQEGDHPRLTREQAATDAGLSEHQRKTALRVAAVPESDFAAQVESDSPPTLTELAKQGTAQKPRPLVDLGGIDPAAYAIATQAQGALREFASFCKKHDPVMVAGAFQPHEFAVIRKYVATVDGWLDSFVVHLGA